jgi:hypothetical protein
MGCGCKASGDHGDLARVRLAVAISSGTDLAQNDARTGSTSFHRDEDISIPHADNPAFEK